MISRDRIHCMVIITVWEVCVGWYSCSLLVRWWTHVLANPINICRHTWPVICGNQSRPFWHGPWYFSTAWKHKVSFLTITFTLLQQQQQHQQPRVPVLHFYRIFSDTTEVGVLWLSAFVKLKTHVTSMVSFPPLSCPFHPFKWST